jgi:hypothetical protein
MSIPVQSYPVHDPGQPSHSSTILPVNPAYTAFSVLDLTSFTIIFGTIRRRLSSLSCDSRRCFLATSVFVALYFAKLLWVSRATARDPGSWFFYPRIAYRPQYTDRRSFQAGSFITAAESGPPFQRSARLEEPPELCVGVPSIARDGVDYLRTTIGSLLESLSQPNSMRTRATNSGWLSLPV